jgi:hypothetical protein
MKYLSMGYDDAWKAIIRPPRDEYGDYELGFYNFSWF